MEVLMKNLNPAKASKIWVWDKAQKETYIDVLVPQLAPTERLQPHVRAINLSQGAT